MITKVFEFSVEKKGELKYPDAKLGAWNYGLKGDKYEISLPHSCDAWIIASGQKKEIVIKDLKIFIEEAQQALKELEA